MFYHESHVESLNESISALRMNVAGRDERIKSLECYVQEIEKSLEVANQRAQEAEDMLQTIKLGIGQYAPLIGNFQLEHRKKHNL